MILTLPNNFTSTETWQNSNYYFPHVNVLSLKYHELKNLFLSDQYIIPDYISFLTKNKNNIYENLKLNEDFITLGVSFMKFKGLNEKWEQLMKDSLEWKSEHTHSKYNDIINLYINDKMIDYIYIINYITNILQIMIINIIDELIHDKKYIIDSDKLQHIVGILKNIINLPMLELPVSETIYMARLIPLLDELYNYLSKNVDII